MNRPIPCSRALGLLVTGAATLTAAPAYQASVATMGEAPASATFSYADSVRESRSLSLAEQQRLSPASLDDPERYGAQVTAAEVRSMMRAQVRKARLEDGRILLRDPDLGAPRPLRELAVMRPVRVFADTTGAEILADAGLEATPEMVALLRDGTPSSIFASRVKLRDVARREHVEVDTWFSYDDGVLRPIGYLFASVDDEQQVEYPSDRTLILAPTTQDS